MRRPAARRSRAHSGITGAGWDQSAAVDFDQFSNLIRGEGAAGGLPHGAPVGDGVQDGRVVIDAKLPIKFGEPWNGHIENGCHGPRVGAGLGLAEHVAVIEDDD